MSIRTSPRALAALLALVLSSCGGGGDRWPSTRVNIAGRDVSAEALVTLNQMPQPILPGQPEPGCERDFYVLGFFTAAGAGGFPADVKPVAVTVYSDAGPIWTGGVDDAVLIDIAGAPKLRSRSFGCPPQGLREGSALKVIFQLVGPSGESQYVATPGTTLTVAL